MRPLRRADERALTVSSGLPGLAPPVESIIVRSLRAPGLNSDIRLNACGRGIYKEDYII